MPGTVPPIVDERDGLLKFLAQQRDALRFSVHGLTTEQASQASSASALTLAGLLKHAARCERGWIQMVVRPGEPPEQRDWEDEFKVGPHDTIESLLADYEQVGRETEAAIAGVADLGQAVPVPRGVPWFPQDVEAWSVRWVLFHLIEEVARHAGHADIIRESLDGKTAYELLFAAEGRTTWQ